MKRIVKLTEKQLKMCESVNEVSLPNEVDSDITDVGDKISTNISDFNMLSDETKPVTTDDTEKKICRPGIMWKNNYGYGYTKNFGL